jgi:hypothetical protein
MRPRRLAQQARRLARARPSNDGAAVRIRRRRGDAGLIQRDAVADRHVPRGVNDPDRQVGRHAIQIFPGRMAALVQHRVVVTDAQHVLVLGGQPPEPPAQRSDDVVDAGDVPAGRRRQVDPVELSRHLREPTVAVDEAGDQRATAEIEQARPGPGRGHHPADLADRQDAAAAHRDRLRERVTFVHRHHVGVDEHRRAFTRSPRHLNPGTCGWPRASHRSAGGRFGDRPSVGQ